MESLKNTKNYCIIMAGGIGSRFWPMSRVRKPKQFIDVLGTGETLLQATFRRAKQICPVENIYIVTSKLYSDMVSEDLADCPKENILCEPVRRNTAPCIAYAMCRIEQKCKDALVLVMPSDHFIMDEENFNEQIHKGFAFAEKEKVLICLGIKASYPNTGYGYIQYLSEKTAKDDNGIRKVKLFTEKPAYEMACRFVESGDFLWNAGIFIWSTEAIGEAFAKFLPEIKEALSQGEQIWNTEEEEEFIEKAYSVCPSISIDYGVMEKAENVYVIKSDFGWSDVGTWGALYDVLPKDDNGNSVTGKNVMLYDCKDCMINVPKDKLLVLQGLEDYMVIESDGVLMMCRRGEEQRIKQFITDVEVEMGSDYI